MAVVIAYAVKTFVGQAFYIPSGSMIPQLEVGDRVVVSKLAYRLHDERRGDVLVFDSPTPGPKSRDSLPVRVLRAVAESVGIVQPSTEEFIKRVVGLPGETVEGRGGRVFVDGRELVEPYLAPEVTTTDFEPRSLGRGELWVMGDNRANSSDSRVFGPIPRSKVVGRAFARVWPLRRAAFL